MNFISGVAITATNALMLMSATLAQEVRLETLASSAYAGDDNAETDDLSYNLYLPSGYEAEVVARYPALYLLHGECRPHSNPLQL